MFPESLFSCTGRDKSLRRPRVLHLGGLCGPEPAKRSWLSREFGNARPPSRFSSEIGTKADAKQHNRASVCVCDSDWVVRTRNGSPHWPARGSRTGWVKVFWRKELLVCLHSISWFARGARPRGTRRRRLLCRLRHSGAAFARACIRRRPRNRTRRCAR